MASAVLASRNEYYWGERKVYMRNITSHSATNNNPHLQSRFNTNPNPIRNPIPNPNPSFRQIHEPSPKPHLRPTNEPSPVPPAMENTPAFNRNPASRNDSYSRYVTYNLDSISRRESIELKNRLILERERVRNLLNRIKAREFEARPGFPSRPPPVQVNQHALRSSTEKRTPKTNRKAKTSKLSGKRGPQIEVTIRSGNETKRLKLGSDSPKDKVLNGMMKKCEQILTKLMKHKHGWVFNNPVDVEGLGLHDYYRIIKHPMDLGSIKLMLQKNQYISPMDFASDVRLTFSNAMTYNPKGQDVHVMAEILLGFFEALFTPAYKKFEADQRKAAAADAVESQANNQEVVHLEPAPRSLPRQMAIARISESVRPQVSSLPPPVEVQQPSDQVPHSSVQVQSDTMQAWVPSSIKPIDRPEKSLKPKVKDPNKREMSFEEKKRLGADLENLPVEKLEQIVQIVKKKDPNLMNEGDEIELDIDTFDNETLWELERFVGDHKKTLSKLLAGDVIPASKEKDSPEDVPVTNGAIVKNKKGDAGDDDVDIGEEILVNDFPPIVIERDVGEANSGSSSSSSSSSGSDSSSSSSDSDSSGSSGSDSDEDSVQSPFVEGKRSPGK